jgi:multidrug resistance efflux pump
MLSERRPLATEAPPVAPPPIEPPVTAPPRGNQRRRPSGELEERVRSLSLAQVPERGSALWTNLAWAAALVLVAISAWYGYRLWTASAGDDSTTAAADLAHARDAAAPATPHKVLRTDPAPTSAPAPAVGDVALESKGYIVPAHQILVSPKVSGMIVQLNIEEGRRVAKGDVLAILESTDYEADLSRAKASVQLVREQLRELQNGNRPEEISQSEAELRQAEAELVQLDLDYKRTEDLRRRTSATQQELELAQSKFLAQKQRVQKLSFALKLMQLGPRQERIAVCKAELAQAEADVVKAQWRLGNCTVVAPLAGTILKKNAEAGNVVNPIAQNGSFSLCEMADLSDLEVELDIQERDIAAIRVGQNCRVRAEAYPARLYHGVVDRLMPIANRAKGAVPVRVKVFIPADEEGVYLKPEMGAIVTFVNAPAFTGPMHDGPPLERTQSEASP